MLFLKWLALALLDWVLLLTVPIAAPVIALFTKEGSHLDPVYNWGWIWGTYDNPPQGDEGFVRKRALFKGVTTGFKGYLNRIHWMIRNPLYGYARISSVNWTASHKVVVRGNPDVSDKRKISGWLYATATDISGKLVAFELYLVAPWSKTRGLRMRLGWKITTDKVHEYGFAQLVNTINPFDGYGS